MSTFEDLDPQLLLPYLRLNLPSYFGGSVSSDDVFVKKFEGGQSNPTYLIKCNGNEVVLRRKPRGKLLKGAHQIEREHRVMSQLKRVDFPVPKMLHLCEDKSIVGATFFVMECVKGDVIKLSMDHVPVPQRKTCIYQVVETLSQLHKLDVNKLALQDFGRSTGYCGRVLSTWTKQYHSCVVDNRPLPQMLELISKLESRLQHVDDVSSSLIHGDYSLMNVMYDATEGRVSGVLDWELSTVGHPLLDFAYFCMFYHAPNEYFLMNDPTGNITEMFEHIPTEEEVIRYYCKLCHIPYPIANWDFYIALNFFKLASIIQGVYSRHLKGNASSPAAQFMEMLVQPLVESALKLMERYSHQHCND